MFLFQTWCVAGLLGIAEITTGSKIQFSASPMVVTPPLTRSLGMKCSLQDTSVIIGKRDVNETSENIAHVTSIIITRNEGEHVALVSQFEFARALVDSGQLVVTGDVSGAHDDKAFIELSWPNPSEKQTAFYNCEINAVDGMGHGLVFRSLLEIPCREPTLKDLIKHTRELTSKVQEQSSEIKKQASENEKLAAEMKKQASEIEELKSRHIESGTVQCSKSPDWPVIFGDPSTGSRAYTVDVVFKKPYKQIPLVNLGMVQVDTDRDMNTRVGIQAFDITLSGFKARCYTWADSVTYNVNFDWLSYLE